ncbi:MAG TPA: DUF4202 domain-containing protein [Planctomycetota bacterium]|nr:DUF4202 domain-containing protein [Planctomycetota bacterium]
MPQSFQRARALIDQVHAKDPEHVAGRPAEAVYAERLEAWIRRLVEAPSEVLLIAARCQHLERWTVPRTQFPPDKAGYLRWRRSVHVRQGDRARDLMTEAGCDWAEATRVGSLVAKNVPMNDADAQALEDAACLVFLAHELDAFVARHPEYSRDKWLDILRKTWAKMSEAARAQALGLELPPAYRDLLKAAIGG